MAAFPSNIYKDLRLFSLTSFVLYTAFTKFKGLKRVLAIVARNIFEEKYMILGLNPKLPKVNQRKASVFFKYFQYMLIASG